MVDENIMELIEKIRRVWFEQLCPQLKETDKVDKELLSNITIDLIKELPTEFFRLNDIYLLMGDIKYILDGNAALVRGLKIEDILHRILSTIKQGLL